MVRYNRDNLRKENKKGKKTKNQTNKSGYKTHSLSPVDNDYAYSTYSEDWYYDRLEEQSGVIDTIKNTYKFMTTMSDGVEKIKEARSKLPEFQTAVNTVAFGACTTSILYNSDGKLLIIVPALVQFMMYNNIDLPKIMLGLNAGLIQAHNLDGRADEYVEAQSGLSNFFLNVSSASFSSATLALLGSLGLASTLGVTVSKNSALSPHNITAIIRASSSIQQMSSSLYDAAVDTYYRTVFGVDMEKLRFYSTCPEIINLYGRIVTLSNINSALWLSDPCISTGAKKLIDEYHKKKVRTQVINDPKLQSCLAALTPYVNKLSLKLENEQYVSATCRQLPSVIAFTGASGVGKSSIATIWTKRVRGDYIAKEDQTTSDIWAYISAAHHNGATIKTQIVSIEEFNSLVKLKGSGEEAQEGFLLKAVSNSMMIFIKADLSDKEGCYCYARHIVMTLNEKRPERGHLMITPTAELRRIALAVETFVKWAYRKLTSDGRWVVDESKVKPGCFNYQLFCPYDIVKNTTPAVDPLNLFKKIDGVWEKVEERIVEEDGTEKLIYRLCNEEELSYLEPETGKTKYPYEWEDLIAAYDEQYNRNEKSYESLQAADNYDFSKSKRSPLHPPLSQARQNVEKLNQGMIPETRNLNEITAKVIGIRNWVKSWETEDAATIARLAEFIDDPTEAPADLVEQLIESAFMRNTINEHLSDLRDEGDWDTEADFHNEMPFADFTEDLNPVADCTSLNGKMIKVLEGLLEKVADDVSSYITVTKEYLSHKIDDYEKYTSNVRRELGSLSDGELSELDTVVGKMYSTALKGRERILKGYVCTTKQFEQLYTLRAGLREKTSKLFSVSNATVLYGALGVAGILGIAMWKYLNAETENKSVIELQENAGYTRGSNRSKYQVKGRTPGVVRAMKTGETLEEQSGGADSWLKNTYTIIGNSPDGYFSIGSLTFVSTYYAIMPRHFIYHIKRATNVFCTQLDANPTVVFDFIVENTVFVELDFRRSDNEMILVKFNNGVRNHKNITNRFITEDELSLVENAGCTVRGMRITDSKETDAGLTMKWSNVTLSCEQRPVLRETVFETATGTSTDARTFEAKIGTQKADCGFILTSMHKSLANKFCGVLVAGSMSGKRDSRYSVVTQQELEHAIKRIDDSGKIIETETLVEHCGSNRMDYATGGGNHPFQHSKLLHIGVMPSETNKPLKQGIRKSPGYDLLLEKGYDADCVPAPMSYTYLDSDGDLVNPPYKAFANHAEDQAFIPDWCIQQFSEAILRMMDDHGDPRILTDMETANGTNNLGPTDKTTAAFMMDPSGKPLQNKKDILINREGEEGRLYKWFLSVVQDKENKMADGCILCVCFKVSCKCEALPREKVELRAKQRLVNTSPAWFLWCFRKYNGAFLEALSIGKIRNGTTIGLSEVGRDWGDAVSYLREVGDEKAGDGDFKHLESQIPANVTRGLWQYVIEPWYEKSKDKDPNYARSRIIRRMLWESVANPILLFDGNFYYSTGMNPSGFNGTMILNCYFVMLTMRMCFYYIKQTVISDLTPNPDVENSEEFAERKKKILSTTFDNSTRLLVNGDDHVFTTTFDQFNCVNIAEVCSQFNIRWTPANKSDVVLPFVPFNELSYLSRSLETGALHKRSIYKMLQWIKDPNAMGGFLNNVNNALREYYRYGEKEFREFRTDLVNICIELGFPTDKMLVWHEVEEFHLNAEGLGVQYWC